MKKIVTCFAIAAMATSAINATVSLTETGSSTLNGIFSKEENAPDHNTMTYSGSDLFVAGNFDTDFGGFTAFTTGDAFIIKYDQNMTEQWKIQLRGSATVTDMLADGNGGVYVAGTIADEVEIGSSDNNTRIARGYMDETWGEYSTTQSASFVAHYNSNGVLTDMGTLIPSVNQDLNDYSNENGIWAMLLDGDTYCVVTKLINLNGQLLAVANLKGNITNTNMTETATSGSYANFDAGIGSHSAAGVIIALNDDLSIESFPVSVASRSCTEGNSADESVTSFAATCDDSQLYVAFNSVGTINIDAYGTALQVVNDLPGEEGGNNYGYSLVAAGPTTTAQLKEFSTTHVSELTNATDIDDMYIANGKIIITGIFQNTLGFDDNVIAVSGNDMYVAAIDAATLNTAWAVSTQYYESSSNTNLEAITGSLVANNIAYIYGFNELKKDNSRQTPLWYALNLNDANPTLESMTTDDYIFGMAGTGSNVATAHTSTPITGITFTAYDMTASGVNDIAADNATLSIYPNPVVDTLNFSAPCDVQVYALDGTLVLNANAATSLDVTDLNTGVYVVKTTADGNTSYAKVLKK